MKVQRSLFALAILSAAWIVHPSAADAHAPPIGALPDAAFEKCVFEETAAAGHYLKAKAPLLGDRFGCTLELTPSGFVPFAKAQITVSIANVLDVPGYAGTAGFKATDMEHWSYLGVPFGGEPNRYLKLDIQQAKNGDELILTGTQTESATTTHGDNVVLQATSVLKIDSAYLVSVQLAFDPATKPQTIQAVEQELDTMIRGIQPKKPKKLLQRIF